MRLALLICAASRCSFHPLLMCAASRCSFRPLLTCAASRCSFRRCYSNDVTRAIGSIFSLSSGHGKCGVSVLRVSGPRTADAVKSISKLKHLPKPRLTTLQRFYDPKSNEALDRGLLIWFEGPHSFTGEDCAEFHVHGGPAVVAAMLTAMGSIQGLRQAEAGEFTKRAFMNGKLDLTEVEGLGDLIHAETEIQRKQALRQMEGELGQLYSTWRDRLVKCTANVEAFIDFSEDENIEEGIMDVVSDEVINLLDAIRNHLSDNRRGERLRSGVHIAIMGPPNVGKSSLLNAICQRPAAIVSPIAGTTRDVIESAFNLGGYPVVISDTAGLRDTEDFVEKEGVKRAMDRALNADIKVLLLEAEEFYHRWKPEDDPLSFVAEHLEELGFVTISKSNSAKSNLKSPNSPHVDINSDHVDINSDHVDTDDQEITVTSDAIMQEIDPESVILVVNKIDLVETKCADHIPYNTLSCTTGHGLTELLDLLKEKVKERCGDPLSGNPSLTQARYRMHLENCCGHLLNYHQRQDVVLAAQELRKALRELGKITGKITSEDILDVVFRDFCIGK